MKIRDAIKDILRGNSLDSKEISRVLNIKKKDRKMLRSLLKDMTSDRTLYVRNGRYGLQTGKQKEGIFTLNRKGFGFVSVEGEEKDYYIPSQNKKGAMTGDTVRILARMGERPEGIITKVVDRKIRTLVGKINHEGSYSIFTPDNDIPYTFYIPKGRYKNAKDGSKVVIRITKYPDDEKIPKGEVIEILGLPEDKTTDAISILREYDIPDEFREETLEDARLLPKEVSQEDLINRKDYTHLTTFTIDGIDAKDFDDAISIEKRDNYILGVHIADVSHYVRENSALDREALDRGNSVYLLSKVSPMLPVELSNELASLQEGVLRLTFSLLMEIDKTGKVLNFDLSPGYIRSRKRLNYTEVSDFLETKKTDKPYIEALARDLILMEELYDILRHRRDERGAIDFEINETEIIVDEKDNPLEIRKTERRVANKLIEEFMLIANETVAKFSIEKKLPFVYRVHEEPNSERIFSLNQFIQRMGLGSIKVKDKIKPKEIQALLKKLKGTKWEEIVSKMALRAMAKAKYFPNNLGHYGLALKDYTHFTSPIRRYSDLLIHRILKEGTHLDIPKVCEWISYTERRADEAEDELNKLRICQYMLKFVGEEFLGTISGVASFGVFVELENSAEGLCRYDDMDDYFVVDEVNMTAQGSRSGILYRPGDEVKVRLDSVNIQRREIDFTIITGGRKNGKKNGKRKGISKKS